MIRQGMEEALYLIAEPLITRVNMNAIITLPVWMSL